MINLTKYLLLNDNFNKIITKDNEKNFWNKMEYKILLK